MKKIAVFISHPIQYQAPLFKKMAERPEIDLMVFFFWDYGIKETYDPTFNRIVKWDIPFLEGYKYEFLKNWSLNPTSSRFWGQINPGLVKKIALGKYEAVIIFGWQTFSHYLAIVSAFLLGIPILMRGENPYNQEVYKSPLKRFLKKILLGLIFKMVRGFLYIGEENKKFYQYYGVPERKLFFVPYAVDNERFIEQARREKRIANRKALDIRESNIVILFVGKLIKKKRPLDLLRAYELLTKIYQPKDKSLFLLFVGDGVLRPELEKYTKEHNLKNIIFAGFKNQTELPRYYALSDIFVLLSGVGETWGLVVNEAMCFSLPIIISDLVGCGPNLVRHGENGYIFPVGDINKLVEYLRDLIENPKKRKEIGEKSFEIIQNYSYKKDIEGILESLKSILN